MLALYQAAGLPNSRNDQTHLALAERGGEEQSPCLVDHHPDVTRDGSDSTLGHLQEHDSSTCRNTTCEG